MAYAHSRLQDGQREGFHAEAQLPHVLPLGGKQLQGRRLAVGPRYKFIVESLHDALKMPLTVPQGVVGIESNHFYILS